MDVTPSDLHLIWPKGPKGGLRGPLVIFLSGIHSFSILFCFSSGITIVPSYRRFKKDS